MSKTVSLRISDASIKRYMKDASVYQLRDTRHSNLRFRFGVKGRGYWYLVLHRNGSSEWKKIGNFPAINTSTLLSKYPDLLTLHSIEPQCGLTLAEWEYVGDLLNWYMLRVKSNRALSKKRKASIKSVIKVHLQSRLAEVLIDDIDHALLDEKLIWPLQERYELSTVRLILSVLKKAFKQARLLKLITFNPLAEVKFSDFTDAKIIPKGCSLSLNNMPRLAKQLSKVANVERVFVLMMLLHGTRIGETRLVKWSHIDITNQTWVIPKENTKTKVEHVLPLTKTVITLLQALPGERLGYLFKGQSGEVFSETAANKVIQVVSEREWRAHDLRKFARTSWMDLDIDYLVGEMLLNHVLNKMDKTYIHTHANKLMRNALVRYHDWLTTKGMQSLLSKSGAVDG